MTHKIGSLIIDIQGKALTQLEREIIDHPLVGGVILFTRNYESREQMKLLCQEVRTARKRPLLIMVDQEGGRVQRFINEFTPLPSMGALGKHYDYHPHEAYDLVHHCGWLMASELMSLGIDLSLAPVLDLNKNKNQAIGDRAFHSDPDIVIHLATVFVQGMREAGMAATGKHFPGHGSVSIDSHIGMPVDERSFSEIEKNDMIPFAGLIKAGISAMMAAHIIFPKLDALPVGYSRFWLSDILRTRLAFTGAIFSDDLNMEGANISANYADRITAAREAGCDFTLLCNNPLNVIRVIDELPVAKHQVEGSKWGFLQGDFSRIQEPYHQQKRWHKARELLENE